MKCSKCGTMIEDGAHFCGACGTRIDVAKPTAAAPTPSVSLDAPTIIPGVHTAPGSGSGPVKAKPPVAVSNPAFETTMLAPAGLGAAVATAMAPAPNAASGPTTPRTERRSENTGSRDNMVGRTLNKRYVVGDKVGEGGFGAVFRGKQLATGRDVALKILHPYNLGDPTIVARFRREAEACSRLRNPHTVITFDFDETEDGVLYLAMELLHGGSLHHLERAAGHLAPDRVLRIIDQVAEALGEAHQNGIVHRDMKPENIFIEQRGEEDYVKVLDFGIAKMMADERGQAALTAVGQTLGTLEFMSPEQLRGQPLDGRSDIYALGIMAYEMLTGELPFKDAKTPVQIINFHMQKPAPPPSRLKPSLQIPAYVDEVILKMVAKSRDDRHADTKALREHIARVLKGADKRADRFEVYRLVGVVGAAVLIISALVYFLSR
jgi:serine/threonine protein kinase